MQIVQNALFRLCIVRILVIISESMLPAANRFPELKFNGMIKPPRSVTIISWIFNAFGSIALLTSLLPKSPGAEERIAEFRSQHPFEYILMYVGPIIAVVCGIFILRGCNWARWLLAVWFGYNVAGALFHWPFKSLIPALLFAVAVYFLFRPKSTQFFRGNAAGPPQISKLDNASVD